MRRIATAAPTWTRRSLKTATRSFKRSALLACPSGVMAPSSSESHDEHVASVGARIVSETLLHARYLSLYDRRIRFAAVPGIRQETELHFDVVGHPHCEFKFAVVFPFHSGCDGAEPQTEWVQKADSLQMEPQVTLIREYCQGPNCIAYCLPTGGYDPNKHASIDECAASELSEEGLLRGDHLVRLVPAGHPGFAEVKWCANRFIPFLSVDPTADPLPGKRDAEETTLQVVRVPISHLRAIMASGDMMLPSITTAFLALQHLEAHGLLLKATL